MFINITIALIINMKRIYILIITTILFTKAHAQSIAFMKIFESRYYSYEEARYLNDAIIENLKKSGLDAKYYSNIQLFKIYNNQLTSLNNDQIANLKMFNHEYIILHKSEKSNQNIYDISSHEYLVVNNDWQSEFIIFNVNTNKSTVIPLAISTFDCGNQLEPCSNIAAFTKAVKDFVEGNSSYDSNFDQQSDNSKSSQVVDIKKKKWLNSFLSLGETDGKFKVVRVKEKNITNNTPISIDIYDKALSLKVGDNIVLTRTEIVQIPGERKKVKSEKTIGKAKIIDDFNKPLYTAKLTGTAAVNFKDYKDGDENYAAIKGVDSKEIVSVPKVMVIPEKIVQAKLINGEYELSKDELLLIGAIKNKLENNKFTTIGFETAIKSVYEERLLNDNTQVDLKSLILESSGADFYIEFKPIYDQKNLLNLIMIDLGDGKKLRQTTELLDGKTKWISDNGYIYKQLNKNEVERFFYTDDVIYLFDQSRNLLRAYHSNGDCYYLKVGKNSDYVKEQGVFLKSYFVSPPCNQNFNFKIRNYATNEDVATDIKQLNTCGSPDDFKNFAESILNDGALDKINTEFKDVITNGKKISVNFTILTNSDASFDKIYNGLRLEEHIQNACQSYSNTYRQNGVVDKRMTFSEVYIPSINDNNGQNYYPNDFALSVIKYLKEVIGLDCEKSVIGQNVNINIK